MNEIGSSIAEAIRKRTASATLGTYAFFWIYIHWQGVYTTLFVSEDKIYSKYHLLKNEYVDKYFFGYHGQVDWTYIWRILLPAILTVVFIWILPKFVLIHAYRQEQHHKTEKRKVRIQEEKKIEELEKVRAEKQSENIEAQIAVVEKKKEAEQVDPQILWAREFEEFKKDPAFESFRLIIESAYQHRGRITDSSVNFRIFPGILAIADAKGLINIDNTSNRLSLTDKGKYFVGQYPFWGR